MLAIIIPDPGRHSFIAVETAANLAPGGCTQWHRSSSPHAGDVWWRATSSPKRVSRPPPR